MEPGDVRRQANGVSSPPAAAARLNSPGGVSMPLLDVHHNRRYRSGSSERRR